MVSTCCNCCIYLRTKDILQNSVGRKAFQSKFGRRHYCNPPMKGKRLNIFLPFSLYIKQSIRKICHLALVYSQGHDAVECNEPKKEHHYSSFQVDCPIPLNSVLDSIIYFFTENIRHPLL